MDNICSVYLIFGLKIKNKDQFISKEKYFEYADGIISSVAVPRMNAQHSRFIWI